ncbi:MAG: hypothetical protein JNM78_00055 [Cyclobacteriaceae bacterium]|nr:hypothetical protein [Cyclobacteriaceae bacterium]
MKKRYIPYFLLLAVIFYSQNLIGQRFWISATPSNWNNTANWSASSGGPGGASVPGASDVVTFNALGLGNCTLDIAANVAGITMNGYTGTVNINGFNLTTTGTNNFVTGTINNGGGAAAVTLNTIGTTTFSGTVFGASVNGSTGRIFFNGSTFNGTVNVTKTANNTDLSTGNNAFLAAVTLTNSSTSPFRLAGTNPDIFNGTISLVSGNSGALEIAYTAANTQFNQNVSVTYNATGAITFGANGGTSTLAATRTISVAGFGASGCGNLSIARVTQTGATAQTINLAGNNTATLTLGPASSFAGSLTATVPSIIFNSSTFQAVTITKTGSQNDLSRGGNIFNGIMTVNNQGGDFLLGTNAADAGDIWNANAIFNNTGGNRLRIGEDNAGNLFQANATFTNTSVTDVASRVQISRFGTSSTTFNGTTTFNNSGNASDVHISYDAGSSTTFNGPVFFNSNASNGADFWVAYNGDVSFNGNVTINSSTDGVLFGNGTGSVNMSAGNTVSIGGSGFTNGRLLIRNFTQAGNTPMTLLLTGTSMLQVGPNSTIGGNANFISPQLLLNGATFGGTSVLEKTGATDNASSGGNVFNGTTTITNSGSGYILLGNGSPDQFNGITTFNNTGSYRFYFGYNHSGQTTTFASSLTLNTNKSGGADAWSYLVNESANSSISVAGNFTINCAGSLQSNHRFLNGGGTSATFNGTVTINLTNTHAATVIQMGNNGTSIYNDNISLVNSGGASGVSFNAGASANSTMAATKAISIGAGGFVSGSLLLPRFTQQGTQPITLNLTGSAILRVGPASDFGGNTDLRSPQLFLDGITLRGTAYVEKTGAGNDNGAGNNVFIGTTTIINNGAGQLRTNGNNTFNGTTTITNNGSFDLLLELASGSTYNGDVTFTNSGTSNVRVAYTGTNLFNGNIIVNSTAGNGITFCEAAAATATLAANKTISIGGLGFSSGSLTLPRFTQVGGTPQTLNTFSGTTLLTVGPSSAFGGNVNFIAPQLLLNGCIYSGTVTIEKNGATDNASNGGNTFTGVTTITNSGSGYLLLGNGSPDQFLSTTTFNNTGSYRIYFGHIHAGQTTTFASDVILNSNKTGGSDAWSFFVGEGANTGVSFGGNLTINCAGAIQSNYRFLNGNSSSGLFQGQVAINLTNTAAGTTIFMGENGTSTYNSNISVVNSGGASGITFNGQASASSTLNGLISSGTFSSGSLNLYRFTQVGVLAENLTLTNGSILRVGPNSSFDGNVNFVSPRLFLNGATYNGSAYLEKNGAIDDVGNGGNIFNGATTLVDSGSGYLMTANSSPDIFNGALTVTNAGSNWIYLAHNVAGNQFNNNITVNNTGSGNGILFSNNASGAATFTNGTITVGGSGFSVGDLRLRRFTQVGAIAQNLTLTGSARLWIGPNSGFDGNVNFVAPQLLLNGATYNGTAYLEKNGATNDDGTGPNIFNQATTIVNSGSSYLLTASTSPDIFNGNLIVTNSGSSTIRLADNSSGNQFNGNIEMNSTFGGGIYFGNNASGTSTMAAGKTIGVGITGVISGDIRLIRFTQVGPTPQTLNLSGIAILTLGPTSSFGGNVDFRAPQLLLNGTLYSGTAYLEKTGATNNAGNGGNTFNGATSVVNSGSGYLLTANTAPDIFNGALTVSNTGSNIIYLAYNTPGNQFNGNITFNSTLGSGGVYFASTANGAASLANGASLLTGGSGFSSGELRLTRFTQIGASPQTLLLTGTSLLRIGPSSTFNGNVDFRSPQFGLDGTMYNGTTYLEKTGANNNDSPGGNTFNGATTIANSGSGWFRFALSALDTFNGNLTLTNTGSSTIRMADNIPGTVFNGNIVVNSTFGGGIYFSESGGGTASLASGRTISVGGLGFSIGDLRLRRFTQNGGTSQNLLFTGTAGLILGPSIIFNGAVDFRAPQLFIEGGSYNNTVFLEKTGATGNSASGNSTFNSTTTIQNSGSGFLRTNGSNTFNGQTSLINSGADYLLLELNTGSTYNGNLTLLNSGSSNIRMAYQGATAFNGNIQVNSTSGTGIIFSEIGTATATLATGRTISVGGTGFTTGELRLQRFTQSGATAQNIVLTGTSTFRSGPSATWNGALAVSSPSLFLDGSILNGATNSLIKTGASTDSSIGGNTFGGNSTFTNSGTGVFRFANTTPDDFTGNVTFNQANGTIQPAYNLASTFRGNVTVDGASAITFGANNGTITFAGNTAQNVIKSGSASPIFRRLLMNKSGNSVTLATDASVTTNATFTTGVINTTSANILNFANGSTVTGGSNASHIDGPVVKIGNAAFSFPTGDNGIYRPISISAPTTSTHAFRAEYFKAAQTFGGAATYPAGILTVSSCEYWVLDRTVGASNVNVTLSWNSPDCTGAYITNLPTLRVVRWNGAGWVDHGNGGTTGNAAAGTLITSAPITSFSPITLGSTTLSNPLPVELISFTAQALHEQVKLNWLTASELNNDYFTIQRSIDGAEFESMVEVDGAGTTQTATEYEYIDRNPLPNLSYYRLRQTDFDKKFTYSKVVAVNVSLDGGLSMHPNPVSYGTPLTLNRKGDYIILNNLGSTVLKVQGVNQIDITSLAPGVYTLRSSTGDIKRLVIQ